MHICTHEVKKDKKQKDIQRQREKTLLNHFENKIIDLKVFFPLNLIALNKAKE